MSNHKNLKLSLVVLFLGAGVFWLFTGSMTTTASIISGGEMATSTESLPFDDRYVGSDTCAACHDDQFKKVAGTKHGKLHTLSSWKGKVVGCESCHGPGKDHVESSGDVSKIISFKRLDSKAASESCLSCHAGKEAHNNFRRGDHWRNNVGCTECHSAHGPDLPKFELGSTTRVGDSSAQKPGQVEKAMLRASDPQLCISCHSEVKAQFNKPFRHRVMEGTMNCSDCHNPHGGFESKQTKLSVGADAACVKCHTNKQGPFVFEHGPLKLEGCTACHTPHGSANPKMLKRRQVRQLCLECHTGITEELAPGVPSFHNQAQVRYQQCTVCHTAIHGSNSSSVFFR
ncbi:MAG: DmsE family decaheme c-type cytochrome [Pyrinomonadaceae bacterium]